MHIHKGCSVVNFTLQPLWMYIKSVRCNHAQAIIFNVNLDFCRLIPAEGI
jgi:hypothetical protein